MFVSFKVVEKSNRSRLQVSYAYDNDDDDDSCSLDIDALQQLWNDFESLMDSLRCLPSSEKYIRPERFKEFAREWARDFRKCTFDEDVTPYIHGNFLCFVISGLGKNGRKKVYNRDISNRDDLGT